MTDDPMIADLHGGAEIVGAVLASALPPGVRYLLILVADGTTAASSSLAISEGADACAEVERRLRQAGNPPPSCKGATP